MDIRGVFYQPLNRDIPITSAEWQNLLEQTATIKGVTSIVVQWNQYGDETFGGQNGWLSDNLAIFQDAGFGLWLGLYSDQNYFKSVHSEQNKQNQYLSRYFVKISENYQVWQSWIIQNKILGVYIPAELSDYDFDTPMKREALNKHLIELKKIIREPIMISVYLSGKINPEQTNEWLTSIEMIGIKTMIQDGRGTQLLNDLTWSEYLQELSCEIAIIREVFTLRKGKYFSITKMKNHDFLSVLKQDSCHNSYLFSLRYLPFENNPLSLSD